MSKDLLKRVAAAAKLGKSRLKKVDKLPRSYDGRPFTLHGRMDLDVTFNGTTMQTPVYIKLDASKPLLLSEGVCRQLRILSYHPDVTGRKDKSQVRVRSPNKDTMEICVCLTAQTAGDTGNRGVSTSGDNTQSYTQSGDNTWSGLWREHSVRRRRSVMRGHSVWREHSVRRRRSVRREHSVRRRHSVRRGHSVWRENSVRRRHSVRGRHSVWRGHPVRRGHSVWREHSVRRRHSVRRGHSVRRRHSVWRRYPVRREC